MPKIASVCFLLVFLPRLASAADPAISPPEQINLNYDNRHGGHGLQVGSFGLGYYQVDEWRGGVTPKTSTVIYSGRAHLRAPLSARRLELGALFVASVLTALFACLSLRRERHENIS